MSLSGKYITKMFRLKRLLVSEGILKLFFFFFVRVVRNQNQGYISRNCVL